MNVLIVGTGKGSWVMRGQQLGAAIGAHVTSAPTDADWSWASVVVLVKRAGEHWCARAQAAGVPIVWDALDFWRQPHDNALDAAAAHQRLRQAIAAIRPVLTIGATHAMADACDGVYLPHHAWVGLEPAAVRDTVAVVAYQGNPVYLGGWRPVLEQVCATRGWRFEVNPTDLRSADILVALRDGPWDGWMCREWKSGVKLVNALAAGRPVIVQPSAAVRDLQPCCAYVAGPDPRVLHGAFDVWESPAARQVALDVSRHAAASVSLSAVADRYRALLATVEVSCAA